VGTGIVGSGSGDVGTGSGIGNGSVGMGSGSGIGTFGRLATALGGTEYAEMTAELRMLTRRTAVVPAAVRALRFTVPLLQGRPFLSGWCMLAY